MAMQAFYRPVNRIRQLWREAGVRLPHEVPVRVIHLPVDTMIEDERRQLEAFFWLRGFRGLDGAAHRKAPRQVKVRWPSGRYGVVNSYDIIWR